MNHPTKITIVIPIHNRRKEILQCLQQLERIDRSGLEILTVVVDDGSTDGSSEVIKAEYPKVLILQGNGNLWWTGAAKLGIEHAISQDCDYVLTLNDDVEFNEDFLRRLLETGNKVSDAIICGVICDKDDRKKIISAGRYVKGFLGYDYGGYLAGGEISMLSKEEYESDIESGYAMLIPAVIFKLVRFDEMTFPHHMGDMDFVLRAKKKGYKVIINPHAFLYTKVGENYFHSRIVDESVWSNLHMFFQIKSTVNLRTRWHFYLRHTPYFLGWISFIYFMGRMMAALLLKILLPSDVFGRIMKKRTLDTKLKT